MFGLFSKKQQQPTPPPGVIQENGYWRTDPGPHTCEYRGGYQLNRTTVRWSCTHCEGTKDTYSPVPPHEPGF